jgi:trimeric autotransporter adhesin
MATFAATASSLHPRGRDALRLAPAEREELAVTRVRYYNTDHVSIQPVSLWQGLRGADAPGKFLITGTSDLVGVLSISSISGRGKAYAVSYPRALSTSVYGPDDLDGSRIRLVGSYRSLVANPSVTVDGFLFQGTTGDLSTATHYRTIDYPGATYNYVHSTMGGFAVGNYDSPAGNGQGLGPAKAYIYNVATASFVTNVVFPGSVADTAYGIWHNGGTSYTICGGYKNEDANNATDQDAPIGQAYLVDYNAATGRFSHWTSYSFPGAISGTSVLTHFEGISSAQKGVYTLNADVVRSDGSAGGYFVTVRRNANGTFGSASWVNLKYPGYPGLSSNSVYGNHVVGIATGGPGGEIAFQATVVSTS